MPRDYRVFLHNVLDAIANIAEFVGGMTLGQFKDDKKTLHAVVRNLEVVGEAVKGVPPEVRQRHPAIPWQRIAGLHDILIHHYFEIDVDIVWDVVKNKLPDLKQHLQTLLTEPPETPTP
jgi:uncharacterized protein with HEPN domain